MIPGGVGESLRKFIKHAETSVKGFVIPPGIIFEELGYQYVGPVDGHNIELLLETFDNVRFLNKPVLVHIYTTKGRGYEFAENSPTKFHGIGAFKIDTGVSEKKSIIPTYTQVFSDTIVKLAKNNEKIVAITAAMPSGTGLEEFSKKFPDRCFDVGISEQHGVTFAAGLSTQGFIPVVAIYSTFLQRAYDMIVHDVALQNLHVIFALDRAGIVGEDGPTHHGLFDISYLRHIPNMILMAPKDENELQHMLYTATKLNQPVAIRYPRGTGRGIGIDKEFKKIEIGKCEIIQEGQKILVISVGHLFNEVFEAVNSFNNKDVELINLRYIKPLDKILINKLQQFENIIVVEENAKAGGAGSAILELAAENGVLNFKNFKILGLDDTFIEHGTQSYLREKCGLNSEKIKSVIEGVLNG
jgi:1-deoxy-D-xylulose-5-phosphate synthase